MFGRWESRLLSKLSQVRWQSCLMILLAFQICCRKYVSHYCRFLYIFILQLYNEIDGSKRVLKIVSVTSTQLNYIQVTRTRWPVSPVLAARTATSSSPPRRPTNMFQVIAYRLLTTINANAISAFIFTVYKIACLKYFIPYDLFEKEWARILTIKKR